MMTIYLFISNSSNFKGINSIDKIKVDSNLKEDLISLTNLLLERKN